MFCSFFSFVFFYLFFTDYIGLPFIIIYTKVCSLHNSIKSYIIWVIDTTIYLFQVLNSKSENRRPNKKRKKKNDIFEISNRFTLINLLSDRK